jgi:hypothetical protein
MMDIANRGAAGALFVAYRQMQEVLACGTIF